MTLKLFVLFVLIDVPMLILLAEQPASQSLLWAALLAPTVTSIAGLVVALKTRKGLESVHLVLNSALKEFRDAAFKSGREQERADVAGRKVLVNEGIEQQKQSAITAAKEHQAAYDEGVQSETDKTK